MSLVLNGSGTITGLSAGGLPDATITQAEIGTNVAGTGPAFSAYQSSATSISNSTWTKIAFQAEEFDTASAFDATTNYRFQPLVAGYYQVNGTVNFAASATGFRFISIYKNGSSVKNGQNTVGGAVNYTLIVVSAIVYLNGSTDYIELYGNQNSGGSLSTSGNSDVYFQASMVRAA